MRPKLWPDDKIDGGPYHGKTYGQVVDGLDRQQMIAFLGYVAAWPNQYVAKRWYVGWELARWVGDGAESGDRELLILATNKTVEAAEAAAKNGKLDEARALWLKVLRSVPDHEEATAAVPRIDNAHRLMRQVADDPDDTAGRAELVDVLASLGATDLALTHLAALQKRNYEPETVERERGQLLVAKKKWRDAEEIFKRLAKQHPGDPWLPRRIKYVRARARLEKAPNDPDAHLAYAEVFVEQELWAGATSEYRKVLAFEGSTARKASSTGKLSRRSGPR
jgi:tetratricopeptide (TPR) repeat protein